MLQEPYLNYQLSVASYMYIRYVYIAGLFFYFILFSRLCHHFLADSILPFDFNILLLVISFGSWCNVDWV